MTILYNATAEDLEIRDGLFTSNTFDHQGVLHSARARTVQEPLGASSGYPAILRLPPRPGITFTYLSLTVNRRAQVIMQDGAPAANVFAAGEIMSGNILGQGYMVGFGMTIGTVFGRVGGKESVRYVVDSLKRS